MRRTPRWALSALFAGLAPSGAVADVILACTFETIPAVVMTYPEDRAAPATMQVAARPPVEMTVGQGSGRMESADLDGYHFRFAPANLTMDVEKDGQRLVSEAGRCATIGGPLNETPLTLDTDALPDAGAGQASDVAEAPPPEDQPADTGAWIVRTDKSALDDSQSVFVSLDSTTILPGQYGGSGQPTLMLRCMENQTSAYLTMMDYFLSDIQGYGRVDYRVDERKAQHANMAVSTDNHAVGYWSGKAAIPFIKTLFDGKSAVFRLTPYNESPVEFSFELSGVETATMSLREACKW